VISIRSNPETRALEKTREGEWNALTSKAQPVRRWKAHPAILDSLIEDLGSKENWSPRMSQNSPAILQEIHISIGAVEARTGLRNRGKKPTSPLCS